MFNETSFPVVRIEGTWVALAHVTYVRDITNELCEVGLSSGATLDFAMSANDFFAEVNYLREIQHAAG